MIEIGSRLRQERKRLGLSQKEMGLLGGVAANAQGKYESGERAPKADYLAALARAGVDVLYVLTNRRAGAYNESHDHTDRHDPQLLMVEVRHAVQDFVATIEDLSSKYGAAARPANPGDEGQA